MRVTFLGGAEEIGASCAILDIDDTRLLIDCGQRIGAEPGHALPDFAQLENGPPIDAILITHAHADHIGALPALEPHLRANCQIFATEPTIALTKVMMLDSLKIMDQQNQQDGTLALFPPAAVHACLARLETVRWGRAVKLGDRELYATWFPAGHILGAAMIEVRGRRGSVLFSGDVSVADQQGVPGVFAPALQPDMLVLESTYGNRMHAHRPSQEQKIIELVRECVADGGRVLFPTFALGRAQEVLLLVGDAMRRGKLEPTTPVFADGLVRSVSRVYSRMAEYLSPNCRRLWEEGLDPIFPEDLPVRPIRDDRERRRVARSGACVVVSSSGMLQGGASQFYASEWIGDPGNMIIITGYVDEESPGQALLNLAEQPLDQPRYFKVGGVQREVVCRVHNCQLSAHADNGELITLVSKLKPSVTLLVHGDETARRELSRGLMAACDGEVLLPRNGESFTLDLPPVRTGNRQLMGRLDPLAEWPPWDPMVDRPINLEKFHSWIASLQPKVGFITLDELGEIWRSPHHPNEADMRLLRRAVYEEPQSYFIPDRKRPYILKVTPTENLEVANRALVRLPVEHATNVVHDIFPAESNLRRFGFFPDEGRLYLEFIFPRAARRRYAQRFRELTDRTNWRIVTNENTEEQDLRTAVATVCELEPLLNLNGKLNFDHQEAVLFADLRLELPSDEFDDVLERFYRKTGYHLRLQNTAPQDQESVSESMDG